MIKIVVSYGRWSCTHRLLERIANYMPDVAGDGE